MRLNATFIFSGLIILLSACGGGGGSTAGQTQNPGAAPGVSVNQLVDGPTSGLGYVSGKQSGVTDGLGLYLYELNNSITFSIGGIVLGSADPTGKSLLTPIDMVSGAVDETTPAVTNILRFLQTIDDDANHDNGIDITAAVRTLAAGQAINFDQTVTAFEQDSNVLSVVASLTAATSAGVRSLLVTSTVLANFRQSMLFRRIGRYCGSYAGGDNGTLDLIVDYQGNITGTGVSNSMGVFTVAGSVDSQGAASFVSSVSGVPVTTFTSVIDISRKLSGTWSDTGGNSGTVSGTRSSTGCDMSDGGLTGVVRIGYDVYDGLFRFQMQELGAPVDVLQPITRVVTLRGDNMRVVNEGTAWLPIDFNFPPTLGRVPFVDTWVNNAGGLYQYSILSNMFELDQSAGELEEKIFNTFLQVGITSLADSISIGAGTVTGAKAGTREFDGVTCTLYDLTSALGPLGQACLSLFNGINGAVALYFKTTVIYTDTNNMTSNFERTFVARKVESGIAVDSSTFTAP